MKNLRMELIRAVTGEQAWFLTLLFAGIAA